jgi:hypothetical protein
MVNTKIYSSSNNINKIKYIFFNEDRLKKYYYLSNTYDIPVNVIYIKFFYGKIISLYTLNDIKYTDEDNIGIDIGYTFGQAMSINRDSMIDKIFDEKKAEYDIYCHYRTYSIIKICKYISILFFTIGYKYMTKYKDYITAESVFNKAITAIKNLDDNKEDEQQIQSTSLYNIACIYSLTNDIDTSLKYLDSAIAIGYSNISSLNTDNDLMTVRKSDKFHELMIKYNLLSVNM